MPLFLSSSQVSIFMQSKSSENGDPEMTVFFILFQAFVYTMLTTELLAIREWLSNSKMLSKSSRIKDSSVFPALGV